MGRSKVVEPPSMVFRMGRCFPLLALFTVSLAFPLLAKDAPSQLSEASRIAIIRGVSGEFAHARITLPRGTKPLVLNGQGEYNEDDLRALLMKNGPAVDVGQQLQITSIDFRSNEILFEINGGGKKKRKWMEHIQLSAGPFGTPAQQPGGGPPPSGSSLLLHFDHPTTNLTAAAVKQLLSRVLDFSSHSAAENYIDTLPPPFKEAVTKKEACVGMDRDMVIAAMGRPDRKIREKNSEGVDQEQWIYGSPPDKVTFIVFEGDKVVSIKQY